jgi:hypothetical protein
MSRVAEFKIGLLDVKDDAPKVGRNLRRSMNGATQRLLRRAGQPCRKLEGRRRGFNQVLVFNASILGLAEFRRVLLFLGDRGL